MLWYIIVTALTVSIDSFFCGFSLSLKGGKKSVIILTIFLTVLLMCAAANYAAAVLQNALTDVTAACGGAILVIVGMYNLVKPEGEVKPANTFKAALLTGFAVGLDGAAANLSLSLMGMNGFYVPLIIALCHALTIWLGTLLSSAASVEKIKKFGFVSPLVLIALGLVKLSALIF